MATAKKIPEKKDEKAPKGEGPKVALDLKWILAGLGLIVITMGSVIAGFYLAPPRVIIKDNPRLVEKLPPEPGPIVSVFPNYQLVNLTGGRFLRFSISLQFVANEKIWPEGGGGGGHGGEAKKVDPLAGYEAMLKDAILTTIGKHTAAELLTHEGKEKLKEQIKHAINQEFEHLHGDPEHPMPVVLNVYFTEYIVS